MVSNYGQAQISKQLSWRKLMPFFDLTNTNERRKKQPEPNENGKQQRNIIIIFGSRDNPIIVNIVVVVY